MSNLLILWLNEEIKLRKRIANIEQDFANGWLLADLLKKIGMEVEGVKDTNDPRIVVKNFSKISTVLTRLRVKLTPATAQEIMTKTAGAAMRIIYQIRMETARRKKLAAARSTPRKESRSRMMKAIITGDMEKLYGKKDKFEKMQKKFFETQLTHNIHEQTKNQRMEQHLKKFREFKLKSEIQAQRLQESLYKIERQEIADNRQQRLHTMKRKQLFEKEWKAEGIERWKDNRRVGRIRQQADLGYELRVKEKKKRSKDAERLRNTMEMRSCIDEFERNLNRIGVQDDEESGQQQQQQQHKMTSREDDDSEYRGKPMEEIDSLLELREKMKKKIPDPRSLEMKAMADMKDLRRRKEADRLARKERTKRRRKVLVDQQASSEDVDSEEAKTAILESLMVECKRRREVSHELWRMKQMKEVIKENSRFRSRQFAEANERERMEKLKAGKAAYIAAREKQEQRMQILLHRYEEIAKAKAEVKTNSNMNYARELAVRIVDLSLKACAYRELSNSKQKNNDDDSGARQRGKKANVENCGLIPKQMWREWTQLFVKSKSLIPAQNELASDADALLQVQPEEGGMGIDELKESTSVNDKINADASMIAISDDEGLVVQAEMTRYFNGEGKWRSSSTGDIALKEALEPAEEEDNKKVKGKKGSDEDEQKVDLKQLHIDAIEAPADFTDMRTGAILANLANIIDNNSKKGKSVPTIPKMPLTICLLGKPYAGKKTQAEMLQKRFGVVPLTLRKLIEEAVAAASKEGDEQEESPEKKEDTRILVEMGSKIKDVLSSGGTVDDEMAVDLILAAISRLKRKVDEEKRRAGEQNQNEDDGKQGIYCENEERKTGGWCLIGFPETRAQAMLFEKKLSGFDIEEQKGPPKSKVAPPAEQEERDLDKNPYPSGIDIVFRVDATHSMLLNRAMGQLVDKQTGTVYHTLSRPPPNDPELCARLMPPQEHDQLVTSLSEQVVTYEENEQELEDWFRQFALLKATDTSSEDQPLGQSSEFVANALTKEINIMLQQRNDEEAERGRQEEEEKKAAAEEEEKNKIDQEFNETKKTVEIANGTLEADEEEKTEEGKKEEQEETPADEKGVSSEAKDSSLLNDEQSVAKISKYNMELNLAQSLMHGWNAIETRFKRRFATIIKALQDQRVIQVKHYAKTRENFRKFLARPANDKAFRIEDFQADFNGIHMDLRSDPSAKSELHQRVDELADQLWEMTKERKNEAHLEMNAIITQGWLEKQCYLLTVHCAMLMSIEMERYRGTLTTVKNFFRIVLGKSAKEDPEEDSTVSPTMSVLVDNSLAPGEEEEEEDNKGKKGGGAKKSKTPNEEDSDQETPIIEPKLKYNYLKPLKLSMKEALDSLVPTEHPSFQLVDIIEDHDAGQKKKPAKSKKGDEEEEEEKSAAMAELKAHIMRATATAQQLLHGIVKAQNLQLVQRIQRIYKFAVSLCEDMKGVLFEQEYPDLKHDIANRIKGESNAIDTLCDVVRKAIEDARPIYYRLLLEGENLFIDEKHIVKPIPQLPKSSVFDALSDAAYRGRFTVKQLYALTSHLRLDFPGGFMEQDHGVQMLMGLAKTSYASDPEEGLPQEWYQYSGTKFSEFLDLFAPRSILDRVDWREMIVRLSMGVKVIPPSAADIEALRKSFVIKDTTKSGRVDMKQFTDAMMSSPLVNKICDTKRNESQALSKLWFSVFKDSTTKMVAYEDMMQYLCFDSAEGSGFDKVMVALGVNKEEPMISPETAEKIFLRGPGVSKAVYSPIYRSKVKECIGKCENKITKQTLTEVALSKSGPFFDTNLYTLKDISRYQN